MPITKTTQNAIDNLKAVLDREFSAAVQPCIDEQISPLKDEIAKLSSELQAANAKATEDAKGAAERLQSIASENVSLKDQVSALTNEKEQSIRQLSEAQASLTAARKQIADSQSAKTEDTTKQAAA